MQSNTPYSIGGEPVLATSRRRIPLPIKLLMPAFLAVGIVVILPLLFSFYTSFTAYRLTDPDTLSHWIGWRNYERAFANGDFWAAFGRTILFLTVALNLELLLGLGVALLLNQVTKGQRALRTVMMFPMMFSPVLVGFQFKFMLNDSTGIVNNLMQTLFGAKSAFPFLVNANSALASLIAAEVWNSTPIFAVILLAGLMALPKDPIEASKVDGCTSWQTFRYVTLPYLMPFIYISMTIRSLDVGRAYDIVRIMTNGGPGGRTELLWTMVGRIAYDDSHMGYANAIAYVSVLVSILFTLYFFRKLSGARKHMGPA
ncbi:binding-protein-dependent transport systems inner membrane component [Caballeronia udeis]|uniref:Binding-protein-dependent transport systems inner membrane component n=2 Tax=Caballeronia udeis TaxID=1232866 RepID=A0A158HHM9_9BURK|nr:sugar ABC transporter permease [Caballeronia udeis]SAL43627.1 binding-protein-dependent transport systems inner membrane component [Caballeronia udeis]